jgi:hypothetical protein
MIGGSVGPVDAARDAANQRLKAMAVIDLSNNVSRLGVGAGRASLSS